VVRSGLVRLAPRVLAALVLLSLGWPASSASAAGLPVRAGCDASWRNPAGGIWSSGRNWSTGAPPTQHQTACITIALRSPVVLSGTGTAKGLTVGGPKGAAELELDGAELTLAGNSTVTPSGSVVTTGGSSSLVVQRPAMLTNHGVVSVLPSGLLLEGGFINAPDGSLHIYASEGWKGPSGGGTLSLGRSSALENEGTIWLQEGGSIQAPYDGGSGAVIDNAEGVIANAGNISVGSGATFIEGSGKVLGSGTGNYNVVQVRGGTLDLAGGGASTFQLTGSSKLEGTIAPDQTIVTFSSPALTTVGSVTNEGVIATQYDSSTLTVPAKSTFYNAGTIQAVHGNSLFIAGSMENTAAGDIDVAGGTFGLAGRSVLVNHGTIAVTGTGSFEAPEVGSQGSVFDNAGGRITNDGSFQVVNGTFVEGAGTEAGNPVRLEEQGTLDLDGAGASNFEFDAGIIHGNIAKNQNVTVIGAVTAPATFTNFGTLTARSTTLSLPPGGTFTNEGTLNSPPSTQEFVLNANLVNASGGVVDMNGAGGYAGNIYLGREGTAIYNRGTLEMANAFVGLLAPHQGFYNTGTVLFGVSGGAWGSFGLHSGIQATGGYGKVVIDGVVEPVFADGTQPAPASPASPWPPAPKTIAYQMVGGGGGQPGVFNISCAATVMGRWTLSCPSTHRPAGQGGDSGQAILTAHSATTLDPTVTSLASTEPIAGYGRAFTSHYGQSVTLTATVRQEHGVLPTGEVTFYDVVGVAEGIDVLGTVGLSNVAGVATANLTTRSLGVGLHDIVAFYPGDEHSLASTSRDYTQQVAPDPTAVQISKGPETPFGTPETLRAVVSPGGTGPEPPTGDVVFLGQGGGQYLGAVPVSTVRGATQAALSTTALLPGPDNVVAVYLGDNNYVSSASPVVDDSALPPA
jgi:hypothetical protein